MTSTSLFCYSTRMLDFDDDGDLDILSTSRHEFGIDSMTVFENDGAGVFSVAPPLPAGAANVHVTSTQAGDFDLDGDIDLVASYTGGFPLFLRNLGGLQFELVPGTMPFGLAFDLDGDGDLDFVRRTDQVFENLGNNVFVARSTGLVGDDDQAINAVVDVDGDGDLDLVGGQNGWNRPRIFANDGDANFVPMQELRVPSTPSVVKSLFDVDGDGDLDVVRTETSLAWELDVLVNDGRGFFTSRSGNANPLTSPLLPICMAHGDVDGDGYQDLFVGDFGQDTLTLNDGSGVFVAASASWLPPEPLHRTWLARLADLDGDGDLDLIKVTSDDVTRDVDDTLRVYLNDSARFVPHSVERVQSPASPTLDLAIADFDADGDLDVALVDQSRIRLMVNDGAGGLSPSRRSAFGPGAAGGVAIQQGDLDGDGDVDLLQPDVPVVWFNDGAGRFRPTRLSVVGPMTAASFVVDVDLDGDLDLLLETPSRRDSFEQRVSQNVLLLNDGAGNFSRAASTRLPLAAQWADGRLIGDLDGDLDVDVLVDGPLAGVLVNLHHDLWVPHRVADGGGLDLEFFAQPGYQSQPTSVVPLLSIGAMPQPVTLGTLGRFWLEPVSLIALNPIPLVDGAARMSLPLSVDSSLIGSKITTQGLFLNTEATLSNLWTETVIH